ncbi:MAG TPA: hypothetical protein VNE58_11765 [Casimicrobiaceae bacterium]|nr:hypothetical protein [Casimicrobiaceae bacterium]
MMLRVSPRHAGREAIVRDADATPKTTRAMRQLGLLLLCTAWIALGLIGRDPWKTEDAITFSTAWEMRERGDWVVPHVAQERAIDQSPLVPWLAASSLSLMASLVPPPDAARLAAAGLLAMLLIVTGAAGRELNGRPMRWMPVLIVVGSVGLFDRSHQLSPELGLATAIALALYGAALAVRKPGLGGLALGVGTGLAFLASGWAGPFWSLAPALVLPAFGAHWRTRSYVTALAIAVVIALPIVAAWPMALHARSPALFAEWWSVTNPANTLARIAAGNGSDPLWLVKNVVWFAWPAFPLILWMLWIRGRSFNGGLAQPGVIVPSVYALLMLGTLAVAPDPRLMQMMPVLMPLALVASLEVDSWKRDYAAALDWFGILTFGLAAIVLWAFWIDAYVNGMSTRVAVFLRDSETGYGTTLRWPELIAAVLLTALWIVLVRPARRSNRRAILNWAAGITLVWGLVATLWLPYLDARRTYRAVAQSIGVHYAPGHCIARRDIGEAQRALFYYFAGVVTVPDGAPQAKDCPLLLVQYGRLPDGTPALPGYRIEWEGTRRGDVTERFVLYRRDERPPRALRSLPPEGALSLAWDGPARAT